MTVYGWGMSLSPGNEQAYYWSTWAATQEGTRNYPGVRDSVVDELVDRMTEARDRDAFVGIVRAMDRVLLWGHYFVPLYHLNDDRIAYCEQAGSARGHTTLRNRSGRVVGGMNAPADAGAGAAHGLVSRTF